MEKKLKISDSCFSSSCEIEKDFISRAQIIRKYIRVGDSHYRKLRMFLFVDFCMVVFHFVFTGP